MNERARAIGLWGGRIGRTVGRLAVVGGCGAAIWGAGQMADGLFLGVPDYNDSPTHSSSDPQYLREKTANEQQISGGLELVVDGTLTALSGFALDTMLYRRPDEDLTTQQEASPTSEEA